MALITYKRERKASEYDGKINEIVGALLDANANNPDADEMPAWEEVVPTIDANKFYVAMAAAARDAGKTAVFKVRESDGKTDPKRVYEMGRLKGQPLPTGNTRFVIVLTDKRKASRGSKPEEEQPTLDGVEEEA